MSSTCQTIQCHYDASQYRVYNILYPFNMSLKRKGRVVGCFVRCVGAYCILASVLLGVPPLKFPSLPCSLRSSLAPPLLTPLLISLATLLPPFLAPSLLRSLPPASPSFDPCLVMSLPRSFPSSTLPPFLHSRSLAPSLTSSLPPSLLLFPPSLPPSPCSLPPTLHPSSLLPCPLPACLPPAVQLNVHRV